MNKVKVDGVERKDRDRGAVRGVDGIFGT